MSALLESTGLAPGRSPVPFLGTVRRWREPDARRLLLGWLVASLVVIPTGTATRVFEWTGIPIHVGGLDIFVSIYLPLLFCVACVMWLGYVWAAIPAYFATVGVAILGGMPPVWIAVFAFANPLGLAVFALAYRAVPIRTDLRSPASASFFVLVAFVSALVGSVGSFVWGYTSHVDAEALMPVWQGWWIGGTLQAVLVSGPMFFALTGPMERWKARQGWTTDATSAPPSSRLYLFIASGVVVGAVGGYVMLVRYFSQIQLQDALSGISTASAREAVMAAVEGLGMVHWVLLLLLAVTTVFWYQAALHWTSSLRTSRDEHRSLNLQLRSEIETRQRAENSLRVAATHLREINDELTDANDTKDRFFSIVAHDLRSPLSAVVSVSDLLVEDVDDMSRDELKQMLGMMRTSATRLNDFLDNLLTWARLQTGGMQYNPRWIRPDEVIDEVADLMAPTATTKGLHLRTHIEPGYEVEADENMLRSVVLNLVSNAIKFTPAGGHIEVRGAVRGGRLTLQIRDTGRGMSEERLGKLFRTDTAFSTPGTEDEAGTGLGLILCKEMAERHGTARRCAWRASPAAARRLRSPSLRVGPSPPCRAMATSSPLPRYASRSRPLAPEASGATPAAPTPRASSPTPTGVTGQRRPRR